MAQTIYRVFRANGTWQYPTGVTTVHYIVTGQGGGGGGTAAVGSGGGGAGGQCVVGTLSGTPGDTLTIAIGTAAGGGGAGTANGTAGSDSTINSTTVVAKGGAGGLSKANGSTGGAGSATSGVGDTVYAGGSGANGGAGTGGAGGGAGGSTGNGLAGSVITGGGYMNAWGGQGAAGLASSGNGTDGPSQVPFVNYLLTKQFGGGGSAGYNSSGTTSRTGGAGSPGVVVLGWDAPSSPYLDENFDGVTPPALPTGWTSTGDTGFACVTSSTKARSGANSLKMSGLSSSFGYANLPYALDGNLGQVQMEAYFSPSSITNGVRNAFSVYARCLGAPSGVTPPLSGWEFYGSFGGNDPLGSWVIAELSSTGTRNYWAFISDPASSTFSSSDWYRAILTVQDTYDGINVLVAAYMQRASDGAWLHPDKTFNTGAQTAFMTAAANTNTTPQYNIAWSTGTFGGVGCNLDSGQIIYCDDAKYSALPLGQGALPASPPAAATDEVELIPSATTAVDSGIASHGTNQLNLSGFSSYYYSTAVSAAYVQLDAGSGHTATPTALLYATAFAQGAGGFAGNGVEGLGIGSLIEGATSSSGPWTNLGQLAQNAFLRPNLMTTQRLDYVGVPGPFRYFRLRTPLLPAVWSQFRMQVQWSSGISWQPCRPILSPGSGRFAAGKTVAITSTSGTVNSIASAIYYTLGYLAPNGAWAQSTAYKVHNLVSNGGNVYGCTTTGTSLGSGGGPTGTGSGISDGSCVWDYIGVVAATPTTGSTLYSGPVTIPDEHPYQCVLQAITYNSGGTTTTSDVTTGYYTVARKIVPDRGITGNAIFSNGSAAFWPDNWYDSTGNLIDANSGGVAFDPQDSTYNWIGGITNCQPTDGTPARGFNGYKSALIPLVPLDYFNWDYAGQIIPPCPTAWQKNAGYINSTMFWTRAHFLINPAPLDSNNRYVCWAHLGDSAGSAVCMTSPALAGPWKFQYFYVPGTAVGDMNVYYDDVADDGTGHSRNKAWITFAADNNNAAAVVQLDPLTDWTTMTGQTILWTTGASPREAPAIFYNNGYYFRVSSVTLPYGAATGGSLEYRSATSVATLGSGTDVSLWNSAPSTPNSAFYIQTTHVFKVPNLSSNGFVLMMDNQDPGDTANPINLQNNRPAWMPISTISSGNNQNAFPSPGVLTVFAPVNWDDSYLPSPSIFTATGALQAGHASFSGVATFALPTRTATGAVTSGHSTLAGSATFSPGVHTATAALTAVHSTLSGAATFSPGVHIATAALVPTHSTFAGAALFSPIFQATGNLIAAHATALGFGTSNPQIYIGAGVLTASHSVMTGVGTVINPTYAASGALTSPHARFLGSALFAASINLATAVLTAAPMVFAGAATFVAPIPPFIAEYVWIEDTRGIVWAGTRQRGQQKVLALLSRTLESAIYAYDFSNDAAILAGDTIASVTSVVATAQNAIAQAGDLPALGTPSISGRRVLLTITAPDEPVGIGGQFLMRFTILTTGGLVRVGLGIYVVSDQGP